MTPLAQDLFCPACDVVIPAADALHDDESVSPLCPICGGPLRPDTSGFGNPLSLSVLAAVAGPVARLLLRVGVLQFLEKRAKATTNKIDDFGIRVARHLLEELAQL